MPSWSYQVFKLELRKLVTYRADFWVNFIGRAVLTFVIFYYLWEHIFNERGVETLKGYTLNKMTLYYLVVPLLFRMLQGESIGSMSREIYDGSLNKYLLYPLNFYTYKLITYFAHAFFYFLQAIFLLTLFSFVIDDPNVFQFSFVNFSLFIITCLFSIITCYALCSIPELISFWADNVWSLALIVRFVASFLGGALIPLSFFPDFLKDLLYFTPFPYFITLPINILFNNYELKDFFFGNLILFIWFLFFIVVSKNIWKRGKYQYTGVGI